MQDIIIPFQNFMPLNTKIIHIKHASQKIWCINACKLLCHCKYFLRKKNSLLIQNPSKSTEKLPQVSGKIWKDRTSDTVKMLKIEKQIQLNLSELSMKQRRLFLWKKKKKDFATYSEVFWSVSRLKLSVYKKPFMFTLCRYIQFIMGNRKL